MNAPVQLPLIPDIEPAAVEPDSSDFDWLSEGCVVVEDQPPIAVYRNRRNHLVIRSRRDGDEDDQCVFIGTPENLKLLIAALQRELKVWRP